MQDCSGTLTANLVDIHERRIHFCRVSWVEGIITRIDSLGPETHGAAYLLPGFIDAHVHVESAMLPPSEFARLALRQGVIGAVCDPHEIANVLGLEGVRYMVEDGHRSPFLFCWGAPSCVPATPFETAGAELTAETLAQLLAEGSCSFLSEVMNFPGVVQQAPDLMAKLDVAKKAGVTMDGHAPGLAGADLARYAGAGISTDHECTTLDEALEKIGHGMHILIREGSAARNFSALSPLLRSHPERVMFCSDDKHPDDLCREHINGHVRRALALGHDLFDTLRAASLNAVVHYGLPAGMLRVGDRFDAQQVSSLTVMDVTDVWLAGQSVVHDGRCQLPYLPSMMPNRFEATPINANDLRLPGHMGKAKVIVVQDGSLLTQATEAPVLARDGFLQVDPAQDLLLMAVINRYQPAPPALALVRGFGLRQGAMASSVAHDSHNIVAVGTSETLLAAAINAVIRQRGGLAWVDTHDQQVDTHSEQVLPLPIAGLMSPLQGDVVAQRYSALDAAAKSAGSPLHAPFMTLSFMALLVIPALKLSDRGLFDGLQFRFTSLQDDACTSY